MINYWKDLMDYTPRIPFSIRDKENQSLVITEVREQIQEDIISLVHSTPYGDENQELADDLCQIVVDNFKKLKD